MEKMKPTTDYHIDETLRVKILDDIIKESLNKQDKDYVLVVDGAEGAGKSTFALQIGKYVDPTLTLDRVCFDGESFKEAIVNAKAGQCIVFDEAFTGLSSRSAVSRMNNTIVSMMMQMRQKNLFVIIVLPSFFLLDKYIALWRCKYLLHVYENKLRRGYWLGFNRKQRKKLYLFGKKDYSYRVTRTKRKGRFYGKFALGDKEAEMEYREKKGKAFNKFNDEQLIIKSDLQIAKMLLMVYGWGLYKQLSPKAKQTDYLESVEIETGVVVKPSSFSEYKGKAMEIRNNSTIRVK